LTAEAKFRTSLRFPVAQTIPSSTVTMVKRIAVAFRAPAASISKSLIWEEQVNHNREPWGIPRQPGWAPSPLAGASYTSSQMFQSSAAGNCSTPRTLLR
jgi:hypothetical protein